MADEKRLWQLINPSDHITFSATRDEAAVIAMIMSLSMLFVRDAETDEPPSQYGAEDLREAIWHDAAKLSSYADVWDSFLIATAREHALFDDATAKMTLEARHAYRENYHERARTSLNDICRQCWETAARIRKEKPEVPEAAHV